MIEQTTSLRRPTVSAPVEKYNCPCCGSPIADEAVDNETDDRKGIPHRTITTECEVCGKFQTAYRLVGRLWQKQGKTVRIPSQLPPAAMTKDRSHHGERVEYPPAAKRRFVHSKGHCAAAARRRVQGRK